MELTHQQIVEKITEWAVEKKAQEIVHIDIMGKTSYADSVLICTGSGELHLQAIANNILDNAKKERILLLGKEGVKNSSWILLDFGEVIVHLFKSKTRENYDLEGFWKEREATLKKIESAYDQS